MVVPGIGSDLEEARGIQTQDVSEHVRAAEAADMLNTIRQLEMSGMLSNKMQRSPALRQLRSSRFYVDRRFDIPGLYETDQDVSLEPDQIDYAKHLSKYKYHSVTQDKEVARFIPKDQTEISGFSLILDVLSATNYMSAGFFNAAINLAQGESEDRNPFSAAWEGLKRNRRDTFSGVLENLGWDGQDTVSRISRYSLGFIADVVIDPINLLTLGSSTAGKFLIGAGKAVPLARKITLGGVTMRGEAAVSKIARGVIEKVNSGYKSSLNPHTIATIAKRRGAVKEILSRASATSGKTTDDLLTSMRNDSKLNAEDLLVSNYLTDDVNVMLAHILRADPESLKVAASTIKDPSSFFRHVFTDEFSMNVMDEIMKLEGKAAWSIDDAIQWIAKDSHKFLEKGGLSIQIPFGNRYSVISSRWMDKTRYKLKDAAFTFAQNTIKRTGEAIGDENVARLLKPVGWAAKGLSAISRGVEGTKSLFGVGRSRNLISNLARQAQAQMLRERGIGVKIAQDTVGDMPEDVQALVYDAIMREDADAALRRKRLTPAEVEALENGSMQFADRVAQGLSNSLYIAKHIPGIRQAAIDKGHSAEVADQAVKLAEQIGVLLGADSKHVKSLEEANIDMLARDYYISLQFKEVERAQAIMYTQEPRRALATLSDADKFTRMRIMTAEEAAKKYGLTPVKDLKHLIAVRLYSGQKAAITSRLMTEIIEHAGVHEAGLNRWLRSYAGPEDPIGRELAQLLTYRIPIDVDEILKMHPKLMELNEALIVGDVAKAREIAQGFNELISPATMSTIGHFEDMALSAQKSATDYMEALRNDAVELFDKLRDEMPQLAGPEELGALSREVGILVGKAMGRSGEIDVIQMLGGGGVHAAGEAAGQTAALRFALLHSAVDVKNATLSPRLKEFAARLAGEVVSFMEARKFTMNVISESLHGDIAVLLGRTMPIDIAEKLSTAGMRFTHQEHLRATIDLEIQRLKGLREESLLDPEAKELYEGQLAEFRSRHGTHPIIVEQFHKYREEMGLKDHPIVDMDYAQIIYDEIIRAHEGLGGAIGVASKFQTPSVFAVNPGASAMRGEMLQKIRKVVGTIAGGDQAKYREWMQLVAGGDIQRAGIHWEPLQGLKAAITGRFGADVGRLREVLAAQALQNNITTVAREMGKVSFKEGRVVGRLINTTDPMSFAKWMSRPIMELRRALITTAKGTGSNVDLIKKSFDRMWSSVKGLDTNPVADHTESWQKMTKLFQGLAGEMKLYMADSTSGPIIDKMFQELGEHVATLQSSYVAIRESVERDVMEPLRELLASYTKLSGDPNTSAAMLAAGNAAEKLIADVRTKQLNLEGRVRALLAPAKAPLPTHAPYDYEHLDPMIGAIGVINEEKGRVTSPTAQKSISDMQAKQLLVARAQAEKLLADARVSQNAALAKVTDIANKAFIVNVITSKVPTRAEFEWTREAFAPSSNNPALQFGLLHDGLVVDISQGYLEKHPDGGSREAWIAYVQEYSEKLDSELITSNMDQIPKPVLRQIISELYEIEGGLGGHIDVLKYLSLYAPAADVSKVEIPDVIKLYDDVAQAVFGAGSPRLIDSMQQLKKLQQAAMESPEVTRVSEVLRKISANSYLMPERAAEVRTKLLNEVAMLTSIREHLMSNASPVKDFATREILHQEIRNEMVERLGKQLGMGVNVHAEAERVATDVLEAFGEGINKGIDKAAEVGLPDEFVLEVIEPRMQGVKQVNALIEKFSAQVSEKLYRPLYEAIAEGKPLASEVRKGLATRVIADAMRVEGNLEGLAPEDMLNALRSIDGWGEERAIYWLNELGVIPREQTAAHFTWGHLKGRDLIKNIEKRIAPKTGGNVFEQARSRLLNRTVAVVKENDDAFQRAKLAELQVNQLNPDTTPKVPDKTEQLFLDLVPESARHIELLGALNRSLNYLSVRAEYSLLNNLIMDMPRMDEIVLLKSAGEWSGKGDALPRPSMFPEKFQIDHDLRVTEERVVGSDMMTLKTVAGVDLNKAANMDEAIAEISTALAVNLKALSMAGIVQIRNKYGAKVADAARSVAQYYRMLPETGMAGLAHLPATNLQVQMLNNTLNRLTQDIANQAEREAKKSWILYAYTGHERPDKLSVVSAAAATEQLRTGADIGLAKSGARLERGMPRDLELLTKYARAKGIVNARVMQSKHMRLQSDDLVEHPDDLVPIEIPHFQHVMDSETGVALDLVNAPVHVTREARQIITEVLSERGTVANREFAAMLSGFRFLTGTLKGALTWPWASYHVRNFFDGLARTTLGIGLKSFDLRRSNDMFLLLSGRKGTVTLGASGVEVDNEVVREMLMDSGVVASFNDKIDNALKEDMVSFHPYDGYRYVFNRLVEHTKQVDGRNAYKDAKQLVTMTSERVDNAFRASIYLHHLDRGVSPREAARLTHKFLFDYTFGLTPFEREVMRLVVPFYGFSRSNIPFAFEHLMKQPGVISAIGKTRNLFTNNDQEYSEVEQLIPPWVRNNWIFDVKIDRGAKTLNVLYGQNLMSVEDMGLIANPEFWHNGDMVGAVFQESMERINPLIKILPEIVMGKNFYFNRDIADAHSVKDAVTMMQPFKAWLNTREIKIGNETFYRVDGWKWLALQELHFGKIYKALALFADKGPMTYESMLPFLTGIRLKSVDLERRWKYLSQRSNRHKGAIETAIYQGDWLLASRLSGLSERAPEEQDKINAALKKLKGVANNKGAITGGVGSAR